MCEQVDRKVLKWFRLMERTSEVPLTRRAYESDVENRGDALFFAYLFLSCKPVIDLQT